MAEQKRWYTVRDLVETLQVHEQTVRRWIKTGELEAYALGDRAGYRVSPEALAAFLERRRVRDAERDAKKLAA
ncbi:MAG TPA: helix-turn-helix domain-containing protein [Dehalococcoidia bacterium]|nr:helix-turn-helix domain-containing protein [Dehalococcoidia bacterium]